MPRISANGVELNYDLEGTGETLVLVHGGWSDRNNWLPVVPELARSFGVVAYDRRGHGLSARDVPGSRRDQEDDLAALIESLADEPVHVAGTSFGGSIAIGLASRRPDLIRSVVVHEPPLMSLAAGDPHAGVGLESVQATIGAVSAAVERGDARSAAKQFVEEIALGPGAWELLPEPLRETMVDSAPAFVVEQQDPAWADAELGDLATISCPLLITRGDASPPWFAPIVAKLADATGHAEVHTYRGSGHAPHLTNPGDYLAAVTDFFGRVRVRREVERLVSLTAVSKAGLPHRHGGERMAVAHTKKPDWGVNGGSGGRSAGTFRR
jgi:pimeloyl-ACP methyl ester carboxylesterase